MNIHELNTKAITNPAYVALDDGSDTYKLDLNAKLSTMQSSISGAESDIATAQADITLLQTNMGQAQGAISSAQGEIEDLQSDLNALSTQTAASIGNLQTEVDAVEDDITDLKGDLNNIAPQQLNFLNVEGGNYFDPDAYSVGYISNSGNYYTNASFVVSDFIPVKEGDVLRYTYTAALYTQSCQLYDASKIFVAPATKTDYSTTYQEVTIPSGIAYARINLGATGVKVITINQDYDATLNGTYGYIIEPKDNVDVILPNYESLKNVSAERLDFINIKKNLFDAETVTTGYISNSGAYYTNASFRYTDFIPVNPGDVIRFTYNPSLYTQSNQYFDNSKTFYRSGSTYTTSIGTEYQESVVPEGAAYIRINLGSEQVSSFIILKNTAYDASMAGNADQILSLKDGYSFETDDYIKTNAVNNGVMFNYICCIGDSLTEGEYGADATTQEEIGIHDGYPFFLARMLNTKTENLGYGGQTTKSWWQLKDQKFTQEQLNFSRYDCFIIFLGTNGGISGNPDPDEDSMMGYYCKIIDKCRTESPESAIFLVGFPWSVTRTAQKMTDLNTLATAENLPVLDLSTSKILTYENRAVNQPFDLALHYGRLGYVRLASEILRCLNETIEESPNVYAKQIY